MDDDELYEGGHYTSEGDPNSAVLNAAHNDMRPDFLSNSSNDGDSSSSKSDNDGGNDSANMLRDGERSASGDSQGSKADGSQEGQNKAESNVKSDFSNNVSGKGEGAADKAKNAMSQGKKAKRVGPLISLLTSLLGGGVGFAGVQGVLPYSIVNLFTNNYDSLGVVNNIRGDSLMKSMMGAASTYRDYQLNSSQHQGTMKFQFSSRQIERFRRSKIEIDTAAKTMTFRDTAKIVVQIQVIANGS